MLGKNYKFGFLTLAVTMLLVVALMLAACGDTPTATPVPPTATPIPPTATPIPPTTVVAAGSSTGTASTGGGATNGTATIPSISNATEIALDPTIATLVGQQLPGLKNATVKLYVSNDSADKLSTTVDTAFTGAGYSFAFPGESKPILQGGAYVGLYSKTDGLDIIIAAADIPSDPTQLATQLNLPGITPDLIQKIANQVQGKKSAVFVIAAPGLLQAIFSSLSGTGSTSTTPDATTTTK
jgi:hypothetical protein